MAITRRSTKRPARVDTEGLKTAQEVAHEAEATLGVSQLDPVVDDATPPQAPSPEDATVWCFAYGSNMNKSVLQGRRMITPAESVPAVLPGYALSFQMPGLPYREPGFATVQPLGEAGGLEAHGVAHRITPHEWEYYKESEGAAGQSDQGYGVIEVALKAYDGREIKAYTLTTQAKTLARLRGRDALPSKRYLELLRGGAAEHGLADHYQKHLQDMQPYVAQGAGGKIGAMLTSFIAFGLLFPMFATMRAYRKVRGLRSVNANGLLGRLQSAYFHFVFALAWGLHDLLRPVLGCGCTMKQG